VSNLQILGVVCLAYSALTLFIAFVKPKPIWNLAKIQAFVRSFGEKGTVVFFSVWGLVVGSGGVYLLLTQ